MTVDDRLLSEQLALPVVPTVAVHGQGIEELTGAILEARPPRLHLPYPAEIETALEQIVAHLPEAPVAPRALALLWLGGDAVITSWLKERLDSLAMGELHDRRLALQRAFDKPLAVVIQNTRLAHAERIAASALRTADTSPRGLADRLGRLATHPFWGCRSWR